MTNESTRRKFLATSAATGALALAGCSGQLSGGKTSIKFWHAMGGDTAKLLDQMGSDFESKHEDVSVEVTSKGSYRETLNSTLSAVKADKPPAVAQFFDIGTGLARTSDAFVSVQDIIPSDAIDYDNFLNPVLNYYRIGDTLNSMPFNSSNPVLYYNKDAFEKDGLDPESPPKTFQGIADASAKLIDSGATKKGITWPNHGWFVEQWMAEQNHTKGINGRLFIRCKIVGPQIWCNKVGGVVECPGSILNTPSVISNERFGTRNPTNNLCPIHREAANILRIGPFDRQ
ncbi:extracellular solute-binding protein [Haladaptatus sp. W1]|uniref:extracellular solute-binding protein n=1 Tax=Haladaptatus sp. W1 TaxID=1897478 RepID=UPI000A799E4A|nr:extracellular solute-binding protein [Haladaptatus sp. W1]